MGCTPSQDLVKAGSADLRGGESTKRASTATCATATAGAAHPPQSDDNVEAHTLNERQKHLVRQSWAYLIEDEGGSVRRGSMIFSHIFAKRPEAKQLFSFRDLTGEQLFKNPAFKAHSIRFMHAVENTVRDLDAIELTVEPTLHELGRRHVYILSRFEDYEDDFLEAIMQTFKCELASVFTDDVKTAWLKLFSYIYKQMLYGYHN